MNKIYNKYLPGDTEKAKIAIEIGRKRGEADKEWLNTHELTIETQAELNALMKKVNNQT